MSELTEAFNHMSSDLRQDRDELELRVKERTEKLNALNKQLTKEVESHRKTIDELASTLKEVKTLSGLLPICSYCKKIRDDKGYWKQIETYIVEHSEADFSHSICRECANTHFPGVNIFDD